MAERMDEVIAVTIGIAAVFLFRALALVSGCGCLLRVHSVSPLAGGGLGVIACAYAASTLYASALMLGFVLASSYLRGCPRCTLIGLLGLYGPYLAAALIYLGCLYVPPPGSQPIYLC